jgi:RNA polymerase sigma factor (sigma-70 family)
MLVVWRKAGTFNHGSRVFIWLFAIAYRRVLKALKHAPDPGVEVALTEDPAQVDSGLEQSVVERDTARHLRTALATLSADQRAVVELTYYHGYAYREIAQIVGCPVDTVKTRMFHARRKLRDLLAYTRENRDEPVDLPRSDPVHRATLEPRPGTERHAEEAAQVEATCPLALPREPERSGPRRRGFGVAARPG